MIDTTFLYLTLGLVGSIIIIIIQFIVIIKMALGANATSKAITNNYSNPGVEK